MSEDAGKKPPVTTDALSGSVQTLLRDLPAVGVSVWLHDAAAIAFRCTVAVGTEPTDAFQSTAVRQALPALLAETVSTRQGQMRGMTGVFANAPQEPTTLWLAPIANGESSYGVLAAISRGTPGTSDPLRIQPLLGHHAAQLAARLAARSSQTATLPPGFSLSGPAPILPPGQSGTFPGGSFPGIATPGVNIPGIPFPSVSLPTPAAPGTAVPTAAPAAEDNSRELLTFINSLQRSLDLHEVAGCAVNDGRLLFGVDRVSLVTRWRKKRGKAIAVSGQESVHPRGNLIRTMGALTAQVIASGEPIRFDGTHGATAESPTEPAHALPEQLAEPLSDFIHEGGARFLLVVPLIEPEPLIVREESTRPGARGARRRPAFAALVIEQFQSSEPTRKLTATLDDVVDHIAAAVYNAKSHSSLFLLPLWRSIGRGRDWLRGHRLALAIAGVLLFAVLIAALILVPWEYRVEATGRLMPVVQRDVFAPWDGQVVELLVSGGEKVQAGQVLLKLRNDELQAELITAENQLQEKRKLHSALVAQRDQAERKGERDETLQLQGKAAEAQVEIAGLSRQVQILQDRRSRLTVKAPITGVVATFQVRQLLLDRPVKRGDLMLQVMDDAGAWHLELEVEERRVGRILSAQPSLAAMSEGPRNPSGLDVEFRLLTQPGESYHGRLTELATRAVTTEPPGSVVEARAELDQQNLPTRTIGAEVRARVACGMSSLGDVLFGDVVEFIRRYLWW